MHAIVGLFEAHDTTRVSMVGQLESLLGEYDLKIDASCDHLCES
jgi:hypothetical protein